MTDYHLGQFKTINAFVADKLRAFSEQGHTFETLFSLMFREKDNILYERSESFRIIKTTYAEAQASILRKAAVLRGLLPELPENAVVGLYMENSLEWIETFWAILAAGFRPLLMNLRLPENLLAQAMESAGCAAVISAGKRFACPTLSADALEAESEPIQPRAFGTELFVMSSGTSEHVKVCAYSAEEFYYQIENSYGIIRRCAQAKKHCDGSLKLLTFLPFYHVFGLIAMYIWFAFFSRTFVHLPDLAPQTIVNTIKRHRVTHVFAVPLFWEKVYAQAISGIQARGEETWNKFQKALALWQKLPEPLAAAFSRVAFRELRENIFGESIRFMISGGSFIDPKILTFFNAIGYRLANGYGMTEIGITSVELSAKRRYLCGGFVGEPMKNVEYRISPDGELQARGKVLARYILTDGTRSENDGWFSTHDLAVCEQGHYALHGRQDDLIISAGGENLNPNLLEPRLAVEGAELCLIGHQQGANTVPVLLASVNRFLERDALLELDRTLKQKIADAGLSGEIAAIVYVTQPLLLPDEFKKNRIRLARDYAAKRLQTVDPETGQTQQVLDELTDQVRALFAAALGKQPEDVSPDADFFVDEGGTSLDYFSLLADLEAAFGVPFPIEDTSLHTVRQVVDRLRRERGGA